MKLTEREQRQLNQRRSGAYYRQLARDNGINVNTYKERVRRGKDPMAAATMPTQNPGRGYTRRVDSDAAKAKAAGVHPNSLYCKRMKHPDCTTDELIALILEEKRKAANGLSARARAAGLNPSTVLNRILGGMDEEEALTKPVMTRRQRGLATKKDRKQ